MKNEFGLEACYEAVEFDVKYFKINVFEELGRALIRKEQDPYFNPTMIKAYLQYINDHKIKWNDKIEDIKVEIP